MGVLHVAQNSLFVVSRFLTSMMLCSANQFGGEPWSQPSQRVLGEDLVYDILIHPQAVGFQAIPNNGINILMDITVTMVTKPSSHR